MNLACIVTYNITRVRVQYKDFCDCHESTVFDAMRQNYLYGTCILLTRCRHTLTSNEKLNIIFNKIKSKKYLQTF